MYIEKKAKSQQCDDAKLQGLRGKIASCLDGNRAIGFLFPNFHEFKGETI